MIGTRERRSTRESANTTRTVVVSSNLDDLSSSDVRFLQEAARLGKVHLRLWSDGLIESRTGHRPLFPQAERLFLARALRYVGSASVVGRPTTITLADRASRPSTLVVSDAEDDDGLHERCVALGIDYRVIRSEDLVGFPVLEDEVSPVSPVSVSARRVVVTGTFDWLHSGHVQFFLDAAALGELYVIVGSDENVGFLKGRGHPMLPQDERRYMVQAVRAVHRALISTGRGWMDAEPEINAIAPQVYAVNEDGDQPEKRAFCQATGLEYVVLRRRPHKGLPSRTSTDLRALRP